MAHTLTLGPSLCGKTRLVSLQMRELRRRGWEVMVLDPNLSTMWRGIACGITDDPEEFLTWAEYSQHCQLVIDEASEMVGHHNPTFRKMTTRFRHLGHSTHLITHEITDLDPTMRKSCTILQMFRMASESAQTIRGQFAESRLPSLAPQLTAGEFIFIDLGQRPQPQTQRRHLDFASGKITLRQTY